MDLEYSKDDFKDCILETFGMPIGVNVMEAFPLLSKLSGFEYDFRDYPNPKMDKNKTIRYINYFYSKGTPLNQRYVDYKQRKAAAAILAGFESDIKSGHFKPKVESMLAGDDPMVNRMIISFVAHNYSTKFSTMVALKEMFYKMLEDQNDPQKVVKVFEVNERLEKLEIEMLSMDRTPKITAALVQRIEEIRLELKPEDVAKRIAEGKPPIDFEVYG